MSIGDIPTGVGWTALLTAYGRAQESQQPEPLFQDPLAAAFVTAAHGAESDGRTGLPRLGPATDDGSSSLWNVFRFYFTQRTPFYDAQITASVAQGCRQVVILGAGLDGRAYRLGLPEDVTVFELDQPPVHEFKNGVLRQRGAVPTCRRVSVLADVTQDTAPPLLSAGFDPTVATVWVAEGLLFYLTGEEADRLIAEITAISAAGSRMVGECFSRRWENVDVDYDTLPTSDRAAWDLIMGGFRDGPPADRTGAWLASRGWAPDEVTTLTEIGRQSKQPVPSEFARPGAPEVWLFAATLNRVPHIR